MWALDRIGRVRAAALGFAVLWSALVPVGGLTLPLYSTASESTLGGSETVVGANGSGILVVLLVPLLVSVLVTALLIADTRPAGFAAWLLTGALFVATVLAMLSIGVFVLPVPVALAVACVADRRETSDVPR